jgi:hypothetical protein
MPYVDDDENRFTKMMGGQDDSVESAYGATTWHGTGEPPTQVDITLDSQGGVTQMIFRVTNLGEEKAWTETVHVFENTWGRALAHLKSVLEGSNT